MSRKALGRGINALFNIDENDEQSADYKIEEIAIAKIVPNRKQPRNYFDEEKLVELAESIKANGIIQPVVVQHIDGKYELIAGERRYRASKRVGLESIPAIVKNINPDQVLQLALIENIQREDLNPLEEAAAYKELIESLDINHEDLATRIGKSRTTITNSLRLLNLPFDIQELLLQGSLSSGHCRALLSIKKLKDQISTARYAIKHNLNVRQLEKYVKILKSKPNPSKTIKERDIHLVNIENRLKRKFQSPVKISDNPKKGKIEIIYHSADDLERILEVFNL